MVGRWRPCYGGSKSGGRTMAPPLTAAVVGPRWAGEGHTLAMRHGGVEVAAICGRTPEVVQAGADRLGVPRRRRIGGRSKPRT